MQGATMARSGRKRKSGNREPNGRIDRKEQVESAIIIALRQPHRQFAPIEHADDARAATDLGQLNMKGFITNAEYAAARRYARIFSRYRQTLSGPNPSPPSIAGAFEPKRGGAEILDGRERKADYDAAFEALMNAGQTAAKGVSRMAIYGEPCALGAGEAVKRGLRLLREFFEREDIKNGLA